jgi:hypothetical protein
MMGWIGQKTLRSVAMRVLLVSVSVALALAFMALLSPQPANAVDCGQLRSSCAANCGNIANTARRQACANRCSLTVCPTTPPTCRPGDQTVCRNSFSSCNGTCDALTAIPSAAATADAAVCARSCCRDFRLCLSLRNCDVSGVACR